MKVIYVSYISGPGIRHMCSVAQCITDFGVESLVVLPKRLSAHYRSFGSNQNVIYYGINWPKIAKRHLENGKVILHLWTNRVFPAVLGLFAKLTSPTTKIVVHLEDEEEWVFSFFRRKEGILRVLAGSYLPRIWPWWHPLWSNTIDNLADGFTIIVPSLAQKVKFEKPTHLLLPGLDLNEFNPDIKGDWVRKRFGLEDKTLVMYCGTLAEYSDVDLLLVAMHILREIPQLHLMIVGDGPHRQCLQDLSENLNLSNVAFTGRIAFQHVPSYLKAADILVEPGRINRYNEYRLPSKIPEYLSMKKPIIAPNIGFVKKLVDGRDLLKTYTDSPSELANCIRVLAEDEKLKRSISRAGRKKAEELFDIQKNTAHLKKFYENFQ